MVTKVLFHSCLLVSIDSFRDVLPSLLVCACDILSNLKMCCINTATQDIHDSNAYYEKQLWSSPKLCDSNREIHQVSLKDGSLTQCEYVWQTLPLSQTSCDKNCQSLLYLQRFSQLLRIVRVLLGNSFEPLYSCAATFPSTLKSFGTWRYQPVLISSGHCNSNITPHNPLWGNENVSFRVVEVWAFGATAHLGLV